MKAYQYQESGLDNIWLTNGYSYHETKYGKGVSFHDIEGLHKVIGKTIVCNNPELLQGPEIRYLRIEMNLKQADLANILCVDESTFRNWERDRNPINGSADRLLRALYMEHIEGDGFVTKIIDRMAQLDRQEHREKIELVDTDQGWKEVA